MKAPYEKLMKALGGSEEEDQNCSRSGQFGFICFTFISATTRQVHDGLSQLLQARFLAPRRRRLRTAH